MKRLLWICRDMCHTFIWNIAGNIHLKSFYKTFTQWQSRMKRFACRTSHGNPPASGRWSPDDRTMCVPSWDSRKGIGRFPDGSPPDAARSHGNISVQSAGTSRDVRADILRCPSDAKNSLQQFPNAVPMCRHRQYWPRHRTAASWFVTVALRPTLSVALGTIPDWISRNPQGLHPAEIRSIPQESKWKVTELYEKSSRHYQNLHFQSPWFFSIWITNQWFSHGNLFF